MDEEDRPPSNLSSGAEELVSTVLERARRHVSETESISAPENEHNVTENIETEPTSAPENEHNVTENIGTEPTSAPENEEEEEVTKSIVWATCGDFTVDLGKRQIEEYVRTCWEEEVGPERGWLSSLDFLRTTEPDQHRSLHHYRLRWSVPTSRKPVPVATACVHFVVEVSQRARARDVPVEVRFVVESNRLVHSTSGTRRSRFREKWLRDVIESKALVRAAVDF